MKSNLVVFLQPTKTSSIEENVLDHTKWTKGVRKVDARKINFYVSEKIIVYVFLDLYALLGSTMCVYN
jgi:hypothetical protein